MLLSLGTVKSVVRSEQALPQVAYVWIKLEADSLHQNAMFSYCNNDVCCVTAAYSQ
jgi:hypothetical protein